MGREIDGWMDIMDHKRLDREVDGESANLKIVFSLLGLGSDSPACPTPTVKICASWP